MISATTCPIYCGRNPMFRFAGGISDDLVGRGRTVPGPQGDDRPVISHTSGRSIPGSRKSRLKGRDNPKAGLVRLWADSRSATVRRPQLAAICGWLGLGSGMARWPPSRNISNNFLVEQPTSISTIGDVAGRRARRVRALASRRGVDGFAARQPSTSISTSSGAGGANPPLPVGVGLSATIPSRPAVKPLQLSRITSTNKTGPKPAFLRAFPRGFWTSSQAAALVGEWAMPSRGLDISPTYTARQPTLAHV